MPRVSQSWDGNTVRSAGVELECGPDPSALNPWAPLNPVDRRQGGRGRSKRPSVSTGCSLAALGDTRELLLPGLIVAVHPPEFAGCLALRYRAGDRCLRG